MLVEFKDQPEFGIWRATDYGPDGERTYGYWWLKPTPNSHPGLSSMADGGMIGVRRSAIRPVQTNPDQLELL